jgi:hypothetical protein
MAMGDGTCERKTGKEKEEMLSGFCKAVALQ